MVRLTFLVLLLVSSAARSGEDSVALLERATRDPDRGVRYAAVQALGKARAGWPSIRARLDDDHWCVRQAAGVAAQAHSAAVLDDLKRIARGSSIRAAVEAVEALGHAGPGGRRALIELLYDKRPEVLLATLDAVYPHRGAIAIPEKRIQELRFDHGKAIGEAADLIADREDTRQVGAPVESEPLKDLPDIDTLDELSDPLTDEEIYLLGQYGKAASEYVRRIESNLTHKDPRIRGAAVWALGRMEIEVATALDDDHPVVRELALATLSSAAARRVLDGKHSTRARRLAARLAAGEKELKDLDVVVRIEAALRTGKGLDDTERDVRMAAALTSGDPRALSDSSARVRAAALRRIATRPDLVAPLLKHGDPSISHAASRALIRMRVAAPILPMMEEAHYGVLHYAPAIFEAAGYAARETAPRLVALLRHRDVNVRVTAARCLGAIRNRKAAPALVAALADERLPVVARAAQALGRLGMTNAAREALNDPRARVRAYAAWALGQAMTDDPAPYAPRLPVLDLGRKVDVAARTVKQWEEMEPAPRIHACRMGIWSSDPAVAIPCAAALDIDDIGPVESERCIELLAPEGFREGGPADLDKYRSYLGARELPATLEYALYPRELDSTHESFYGELHRSPSSDEIPALLWLNKRTNHRNGDMRSLWQPFYRSTRFPKLRGYDDVWLDIELFREIETPIIWWIRDEPVPVHYTDLLASLSLNDANVHDAKRAVRLLGRIPGSRAQRRLEQLRPEMDRGVRHLADAALARRGHPLRMFDVFEAAHDDSDVLGMLLEHRPRLAVELLRTKLPDLDWAHEIHNAINESYAHGTRIRPEYFLGLEPTLRLRGSTSAELLQLALQVPGCATRRVAEAAAARFRADPREYAEWASAQPGIDPGLGWLAVSQDMLSTWRDWAHGSDELRRDIACACLLRIGDVATAAPIVEWLQRDESIEIHEVPLALQTPEIARTFEHESWPPVVGLGKTIEEVRATLRGTEEFGWHGYEYRRTGWLRGELELLWKDRRGVVRTPTVLMHRAHWPDPGARADLWSVYRAGRYRWTVYRGDIFDLTLGRDLSTLPFWIDALESNCCVISGNVESVFEDYLGIYQLYPCHERYGQPPSERVRMWMALHGGDLVYHPVAGRFVPKPD